MKIKSVFILFLLILSSSISFSGEIEYITIKQNKYINPHEQITFFDLSTYNISDVIQLIALELENNINYVIPPSSSLLITTLTNLNDFNTTCKLARIIQEGIGTYFTNKGYMVKEIRLRKDSILIKKKKGEFVLSRDLSLILDKYKVKGILSGTYTKINNNLLFITIKIISEQDNITLSSFSFTLYVPDNYKDLILPEKIKEVKKKKIQKKVKPKIEGGPIELGIKILSKQNKEDVKLVQKRLKELGLYNWKIDGIWGKRTQKAVETFKKVVGLTPYDTWDMNTQKRLFKGTNL